MYETHDLGEYSYRLFLTAILTCAFWNAQILHAQPSNSDFQITTLNGLAQNTINYITQDEDGFIWYGTQTSLERFDGDPTHLAQWYVSEFSAKGYVKTIKTLSDKVLIGTHDSTLMVLSGRFSDASRSKLEILNATLGNIMRMDVWSGYYVVVSKKGLFLLDESGKIINQYLLSSKIAVECAIIEKDMIFVGVKDSLLQYKISGDHFDKSQIRANSQSSPSSFFIAGDTLWVGSKDGVIRALDIRSFQYLTSKKCSKPYDISALLVTKSGEVWAGTDGDGIHIFDKDNQLEKRVIRKQQRLSSNFIAYLFESSDETIFIGTSGGGLCRYYPHRIFKHLFSDGSDANNFLWSLYYINEQYLLAGTKGAGLRIVNILSGEDVTEKFGKANPKTASLTINSIEKVQKFYLLGTDSGLYKLNLNLPPQSHYQLDYYKIEGLNLGGKIIARMEYDAMKDRLLIGNRSDKQLIIVNRVSSSHPEVETLTVSGAFINSIIDLPDRNIILVGTDNGIDVFKSIGGKFVSPEIRLPKKVIMTILPYKDNFYAATRNGEVFILEKENFLSIDSIIGNSHNEKNGLLPPSALYGLLEDSQGFIWISSNVGLFRLKPGNKALDHYKDDKTIGQLEFNRGAFINSDDKNILYFGGPDGIVEVNTRKLVNTGPTHPVHFFEITYYVKGSKTILIRKNTENIRLPNNIDYVEIRPIYLCYDENHNHYITFYINNDTVNYNSFSPEALLNGWKYYFNRLGIPICVSITEMIREGLFDIGTEPVEITFDFAGAFIRFLSYCFCLIVGLIVLYWFIKRTREKTNLIESMNKISATYGTEKLLNLTIAQLLDDFQFHYAIISLIDYKNKKITSTKYEASEKIKYFWGRIKIKNPLVGEIDQWAESSQYNFTLKEKDILCQMLGKNIPSVWFVGPFSDHEEVGYNNLNPDIYNPHQHRRFSRFFISMVDGTNILGESGEGQHHFPIGVIEAGFKRTWFRLAIDYLYFIAYRFIAFVSGNLINAQPVKFDLQMLADNLSQTYLQSFLKEEKEILTSKIKSAGNGKQTLEEYWNGVLGCIAEYTNSKYAKIDVLTFNEEEINLKESFIAYPQEKALEFCELLEQANNKKQNKDKIGISKHVINTKNVHISNDVDKDFYYLSLFEDVKSEMGLPISYNGKVVAVLILSSLNAEAFSQAQVAILQEIINDIWSVSMSKRRVLALESISSPNYNIAAESTARIYRPVVNALAAYFRSDFISVWEKMPLSDEAFELSSHAMASPLFYDMYAESNFTLNKKIREIHHDKNQPVVSIIKKDEPDGKSIKDFFEKYHFHQYIAVKIVVEGRYEGFINIFSRREITISADDYLFLTQISNYVSASIIANKLFKAFRDMSESFDKGKEMYQKLVNHAKELSRADLVSFFPLVDEEYILKEGIHSPLSKPIDFSDVEGRANLPRVILKIGDQYISNEHEYVSILEEDMGRKLKPEDVDRTFWKRFGNNSVAAIRLKVNDKKLGIIFFNYKTQKDFTTSSPTKEIIEIFSNFAKILILNHNIIEKIQEETSKLQQQTDKLQHEGQVYERLARNHQRLIRQNQEKIEELVEVTDRYRDLVITRAFYSMVDGLLHECKNYLFLLIDKLKRLEREGTSNVLEAEVKKVRTYAQSVDKILNIFNIQTEEVESLDLLEIIKPIMNFFKSFGDNTDVIFEIEDHKKIYMTGNKTEIALIFHNLIANAMTAIDKVKSSKPNFQGNISVSFEEAGNYFTVKVRDNGSGIDARYLPDQIFKRGFSTKTDPDTHKVVGTGIGLSYVKEILEEQYQSEIKCKSKVGVGTTFLITFPKFKIR